MCDMIDQKTEFPVVRPTLLPIYR